MSERPEIDAIEQRVNEATPGPWYRHDLPRRKGVAMVTVRPNGEGDSICQTGEDWASNVREDAEFIAAAREDVPTLIAYVRELTAERDRYKAALEEIGQSPESDPPMTERFECGLTALAADYGMWRMALIARRALKGNDE